MTTTPSIESEYIEFVNAWEKSTVRPGLSQSDLRDLRRLMISQLKIICRAMGEDVEVVISRINP